MGASGKIVEIPKNSSIKIAITNNNSLKITLPLDEISEIISKGR